MKARKILVLAAASALVLAACGGSDSDSGGSDSGGALAGIFTERDVLRRVVALGFPPEGTAVADVMTVDVVAV
ncbi:MAG: hypothetical protein EBT79_03980 [Actinobacteria bacterium]|nr:hypothetical protein [Actinomycetota bacterium]